MLKDSYFNKKFLTKNGSINMRSTSLQSTEGVCNCAAGVVVEVGFNVAVDDTSKHTNKLVDLAGRGALVEYD